MAAQEPGQGNVFRIDVTGAVDHDGGRSSGGHGLAPESMGLRSRGHRAPMDEDPRP